MSIDFSVISKLEIRKEADLLVVPFWRDKNTACSALEIGKELQSITSLPLETKDFAGKEGEVSLLYTISQKESRLVLLGLGEENKVTLEKLRRIYASLAKFCQRGKIQKINLALPIISSLNEAELIRGISEGLLLVNYTFEKLKKDSIKDESATLLKKVALIGGSKKGLVEAQKAVKLCDAVNYARDLVNGNADDVTPQALVEEAKNLAKSYSHVKVTIFDKKRIEKEKLGLLLAVNRGSTRDPAFIILEYKGNPRSKEHTALIGKGITYDTGGLNLKPTGSMETMKCDMSGAAAVLGTIRAAAELNLKVNITGVIPSTENSIGSKSYKPGDVYVSYSGKTVEIANTDAEGRLVLADALAYTAKNLKPSKIIDLATLTGAVVVCLGDEAIGLMSNHDALAEALIKAGNATFERVWRLPLFEEYKKQIKSDIADIKNSGGRQAGTITAALFLEAFVENIPWAHLDIAGTAYLMETKRYQPKHGTGVGVRLLIEYLEQLAQT
jgi:leucyl aminopeptidase